MGASHQVNISGQEPDDDGLIDIVVSRSQARRRDQDAQLEDDKKLEKERKDDESEAADTKRRGGQHKKKKKEEEWIYPSGAVTRRFIGIYSYSNWRDNNITQPFFVRDNENFDINDWPGFPSIAHNPFYAYTETEWIQANGGLTECGDPKWVPSPEDFSYESILDFFKYSALFGERDILGKTELPPAHWKMAVVDLDNIPDLEESDAWINKSSQDDYSSNNSFDDSNYLGHEWSKNFMESLEASSKVQVYDIAPPFQNTVSCHLYGDTGKIWTRSDEWHNRNTAMYEEGETIVQGMWGSGSSGNHYEIPEWFVAHSPDGKTTWAYEIRTMDYSTLAKGYNSYDDYNYDRYYESRTDGGYNYSPPGKKNNNWMFHIRKNTQEIWYTRIRFDHANKTQKVENGKIGPFLASDDAGGSIIDQRASCINQDESVEPPESPFPTLVTRRTYNDDEIYSEGKADYNKYTGFHEYSPTIDQLWSKVCDQVMFEDDPSIDWRRQGYADTWVFDLENETIIRTGIINRKRLIEGEINSESAAVTTRDFYISNERVNNHIPVARPIISSQPPVPNAQVTPCNSSRSYEIPDDLVSDPQDLLALLESGYDQKFHGVQDPLWSHHRDYMKQHQILHTFDPLAHQQFTIRVKVPGLKNMTPQQVGRLRHGIPVALEGSDNRGINPYARGNDLDFEFQGDTNKYNPEFPEGTTFEIQFTPQDEEWCKSFRRLIHSWYSQTTPFFTYQSREFPNADVMENVRRMEDGNWAAGFFAFYMGEDTYWYTDSCFGDNYYHRYGTSGAFGQHWNLHANAGMWQFIANPFIGSGGGDPTLPYKTVRLGIQDFTVVL